MDFSSGVTRFVSYGASGTGGIFAFRTASGGASSTERMRIAADGRVGIGDSSPTRELSLKKTTDHSIMSITTSTSNLAGIVMGDTADDDQGGIIYNNSGDYLYFRAGDAERMRIDSNGDLLVNCTSLPSASVKGFGIDAKSTIGMIVTSSSATGGDSHMQMFNPNGQVGSIVTSGSSTAFNTSSDYRLKENVNYDFNALDRVTQLKPARFNFIADADTTVDGFLAHEVQDIVPEAITGEKDAVDSEGNPEYQGIDQSKLVPLLTKAIQEQQTIIDDLKSRIETLEG